MNNSIEIYNLNKSFNTVKALDNLMLTVEQGGFYGLIGPDGAGKTTLMRIITALLLPDSGSIMVGGLNPVKDYKELRLKLGYMPGRFSLYQDLTVEENLSFFAKVFDTSIEENYHLIAPVYSQIEPFKNRRAGKLSGGMKQKLALSCALIHKPEILILDEPTTGVDAVSRRDFWEMLSQIRENGITILVSTPYMEEAVLCDKISLMFDGKIINSGTPTEITSKFKEKIFILKTLHLREILKIARQMPELKSVNSFGQNLHLVVRDNLVEITEIESFIKKSCDYDFKIEPYQAGIEDCFIDYLESVENV
ncbi:MAG: ABC transporter ATP-binding protein [Bacteroidales bacterium]|nr:ABC transporter ATP-binding protein [Bacteroidales bacterium]